MVSPTSSENIECELNALVQDQLQTVTYKFLSKRFSIPYDTSKKILHAYKDKNGDEIVATYLLSGWDGNRRHIVKVVGQTGLEVEKAALTKIEALHVYSVQSISLKSVVSLCEVDLGQNRESLGSEIGAQYSLLGRIVLCNPPKRGKVDAPPRSLPKPTSSNEPQSMVKDTSVARQKNDGSQDLLTRKRRLVTSDSDEEDGAEAKGPASEEKKFKTFINDKGEEVTEMAEAKGSDLQVKKETKAQTSKPKTATKIKQKGIAAFFTKKT